MPLWLIGLISLATTAIITVQLYVEHQHLTNVNFCHQKGKVMIVVEGKPACVNKDFVELIGKQ